MFRGIKIDREYKTLTTDYWQCGTHQVLEVTSDSVALKWEVTEGTHLKWKKKKEVIIKSDKCFQFV
jgi:hypothetical protein